MENMHIKCGHGVYISPLPLPDCVCVDAIILELPFLFPLHCSIHNHYSKIVSM